MRKFLPAVVLAAILASACAPAPQRLGESERKALRSVAVDANVTKPPEPFYLGPGGGFGLSFGALGAAATEGVRAQERATLVEFVERNGVSIERIVLEEFTGALRGSGKLRLAESAGDATIRIVIRQYGLSIPNGFSSNLVPILFVVCEMKDPAGRVLWSASDRISTLGNPVEGRPADEIRNDARAIEAAWRAAARHVSANILKDL